PAPPAAPHAGCGGARGAWARAVLERRARDGVGGEQASEVVAPAVALGLADDRDDLVGGELAGEDALLEAGRVLNALELDLRHFDGHGACLLSRCGNGRDQSGRGSTRIPSSGERSMRKTVPAGSPAPLQSVTGAPAQ